MMNEGQIAPPKLETGSKLEAMPRPDLVAKYSLFRKIFNPKADVVYHPCGANDVSPSFAFPESRVVYVDINDNDIEALMKGGFDAHAASALEFDPGDVDILIMLNPIISPDIPSSHVVENGFVLCNDYHGTASSLYRDGQYQLRAIARTLRGGELVLDTEDIYDYWKEIDTEEDFQNAPFSFGAFDYASAANVVEAVTGSKENILTEYKKIIAMAREERRQRNTQTLAEHPELAEFIVDPDKENNLMFNHHGRNFVLSATLPRKKGTVDDIFVFQKVKPHFPVSES